LDIAEDMYKKALKISKQLGDLGSISSGYGNLGMVYQTRGDLKQAELMLKSALEIEEKLGRASEIAICYGNLGVVYHTGGPWHSL